MSRYSQNFTDYDFKMNTKCVQFRNELFLFWSRPHKGLWSPHSGTGRRTFIRRSRKPAENAEQDKKSYLWMDT